ALEANKPPYFVLSHEHLVSLAARAAQGHTIPHLPKLTPRRRLSLTGALDRGLHVPPSQYPTVFENKGRRLTRAEQTRTEALRKHRDCRATELGIDPAL